MTDVTVKVQEEVVENIAKCIADAQLLVLELKDELEIETANLSLVRLKQQEGVRNDELSQQGHEPDKDSAA